MNYSFGHYIEGNGTRTVEQEYKKGDILKYFLNIVLCGTSKMNKM